MKDFRPEYIDQAMNRFDPQRGPSENVSRIIDEVIPFTGPLSGQDHARLEFEINDEIARRRGMNIFDFEP